MEPCTEEAALFLFRNKNEFLYAGMIYSSCARIIYRGGFMAEERGHGGDEWMVGRDDLSGLSQP